MVFRPGKIISAASTNLTQIKAVRGFIGSLAITNNLTGLAYVKLYDDPAPVVGTTIPVHVFEIPNPGSNPESEPLVFDKAIWIAITGGIADTDTTPVAANQVIVNYGWQ